MFDEPLSDADGDASMPVGESKPSADVAPPATVDDMEDVSLQTPKNTNAAVSTPTDAPGLNPYSDPYSGVPAASTLQSPMPTETNCFGQQVVCTAMVFSERVGAIELARTNCLAKLEQCKKNGTSAYISGQAGIPKSLEVLGCWLLTSINHYSMEQERLIILTPTTL